VSRETGGGREKRPRGDLPPGIPTLYESVFGSLAAGKRCQHDGCGTAARGCTPFCKAHGGGKRCTMPGCSTAARGATQYCILHGGGKRCQHDGCDKAVFAATPYCKPHGTDKRCREEGCPRMPLPEVRVLPYAERPACGGADLWAWVCTRRALL
jgi:hypothetical protein